MCSKVQIFSLNFPCFIFTYLMLVRRDIFKKNFSQICEKIWEEKSPHYEKVNLYCLDESRFGLITKNGKALTAKGVKPICTFQQVFQSTYVFGAFSPITADHFTLELPHCDSNHFQVFLDQFS